MAKALNSHIIGQNTKPITVLPLPTGTGKTQGLCLYCSMLSQASEHGVLIVTALKNEANKIAETINDLSTKKVALAQHGDSKNSHSDLQKAQILIITHSAYQNAMEAETSDEPYKSKWSNYISWKNGRRNLTVIDESIDIVSQYSITREDLRLLQSLIPKSPLSADAEQARKALNAVNEKLNEIVLDKNSIKQYELIHFSNYSEIKIAFKSLEKEIEKHLSIHFGYREKGIDLQKNLFSYSKKILSNLEEITRSWSIYYNSGAHHGLSTARFILPIELNNIVVLDATAQKNPITRTLKDHSEIISLPKLKSYSNLTLHISTGHSVGQSSMGKLTKKDWGIIFDRLHYSELKNSASPLLCVHKDTENKLGKNGIPKNWSTMHWGAINGVNKWKDCDSVLVYGLPYLPEHFCATTLMAFWDWSYKIKNKPYQKDILQIDMPYIKETYKWLHIVVSLVQAGNRAHCRLMIDNGQCPATDAYIFVKHELDKEVLTRHLSDLMPDLNIQDWNAPKTNSNSKGLNKTEKKIITGLQSSNSNLIKIPDFLSKLGIVANTFNNNYSKKLSKKQGALHEAISDIGWVYLSGKESGKKLGVYRQHFINENK